MKKINTFEKAVTLRLQQVDQLHEISLSLMRAGYEYYKKKVAEGKEDKKS